MLIGPPRLTARMKKNKEERTFRGAGKIIIQTWLLCSCFLLMVIFSLLHQSKWRQTFWSLFHLFAKFNEADTRWPSSAAATVFTAINLAQLRSVMDRFILGNEDTYLCFSRFWSAPQSAQKKRKKKKKDILACLATYLIATGHHLCLHFPLLVFWALTWLISCLALIRGRISEHSWVSQTRRWESWSAINQSDFPFIVVKSGNEPNADRVGHAESELLGCAGGAQNAAGRRRRAFVQSLWSQKHFVCCMNESLNWILTHSSYLAGVKSFKYFLIFWKCT